MLDHSLSAKKKRHIIEGVLLNVLLLFGGLAFTIITLDTEDNDNDVDVE